MGNIKKITIYLLSSSFNSSLVIVMAMLARLPLPFTPVQLLWHNVISGSFTSFPIAFEKKEKHFIRTPKSASSKEVLTKKTTIYLFAVAVFSSLILGAVYLYAVFNMYSLARLQATAFVTLTLTEIFLAISMSKLYKNIWNKGFFNNKYIFAGVGVSLLALYIVLNFEPFVSILNTYEITWVDVTLGFLAGFSAFLFSEILKRFVFISSFNTRQS